MTIQEFRDGIKLIKKTLNWKDMDLEDNVAVAMWYARCKTINADQFKQLVNWYCQHKDFPPRSPNELATTPVSIYTAQFPTKSEEKNLIIEWIYKYRSSDYRKAMLECPPLIEQIPISKWQWDALHDVYWEREVESLLTKYMSKVENEATNRGRLFLLGKTRLPFTPSGKFITYLEEQSGVVTDADKKEYELKKIGNGASA